MTHVKQVLLTAMVLTAMLFPTLAFAGNDTSVSTVGVQGYDLVAYQTQGGPAKGNGNHLTVHNGITYLFTSAKNVKTFEANPGKYLPVYGGWCAFGVSVGKKFVGDPLVWKVVDGRLYLNLDKKVQSAWKKDIPGNISKANTHWTSIKDKNPKDL